MTDNDDSQIVKRIQSGDQTAFAKLVEKYQRAIHGYAYHETQDTLAAEDITQEVFLDAYLNLHTLKNPERLGAWLRSIAQHKSVDWIRRSQEVSPLESDIPADRAPISEILEREETYEQLSATLQTLSEPNRIVITLKYMEGMSNSQIADFLEVSPSVVSTRLERTREQLQERMLKALETGFPRADFVESVCRQIQACRRLIGIGLQFSTDHKPMRLCTCVFHAQSLAKRTGGSCQAYPGKGLAIWYGMDRIREDDTTRAVETALELQKQSCPAGQFYISIRQMLDSELSSRPRFPCLIEMDSTPSFPNDILVDSSIAWLLRHKFHFENVFESVTTISVSPCSLHDMASQRAPERTPGVYRLTQTVEMSETDILVGREAEIAQLEDAIQRLLVGDSGIIWLTGEAGMGKTCLLRALRRYCERNVKIKSLIWLHGKANPAEEYQPIREAIQSHFGFESADELREHLASFGLEDALPYFAELLRLPFELSDKKFNSLTVEQIHYHAFQYMRDWLIKLAEETPVVWVVDDTHWLSPETSRLLQYLCRTTKGAPVLFLFSRRSGYEQVDEAKYGIELEKQVAQRYPEVYREIDLEPLPQWASLSLLSHFLGERKLLPSKLATVLELAGGNPLYLREVAQLLLDAPDSMSIPAGVERLVLAHLELLPPFHQNLLRYASVLGSHVDGNLLQAAFFEVELSKICEQLQGIGWLQPAEEGNSISLARNSAFASNTNFLIWRHHLYRESIYNSIEPNARRQLHAEIAGQLEGIQETSPDMLANHYEAAGNLEKVPHYAYLATVMCHEQRQHRRVQCYAEMALLHPEALSREQHVEILRHYADALKETGHPSEAIPSLEKALNLVSTNSQRILINIQLADCYSDQHGVALREKALSLIDESTENSVIMEACRTLPEIDYTPSPDVVGRVLHLAQKRKDYRAEVLVLRLLALAQTARVDLDDARSTIQRAIQLVDSRNNSPKADALEDISFGWESRGFPKEKGDNELLAELELGVARVLWDGTRSPEAVNHLRRALHLWQQAGIHALHTWCFLGHIYYDLEQYEAMIEAYETALEQNGLLGSISQYITDAFARLVHGYAYHGDWEKAYQYFWQMLDSMDSRPADFFIPEEEAIGALCHGDKTNHRWIWEGIPQTMARAQELIKRLYEHGITPEDNRLSVLHPILAAGYVEYGVKRSHEEGVAMMRIFARQVWVLDEHVEFWAYLSGVLDYDTLEAIFKDALEQVACEEPVLLNEKHNRPEFFVSSHPEKVILKWLRACLHERYETESAGRHLRQMGIIPEPRWLITGTFEKHVPVEVEQMILNIVFNKEKKDRMARENRKVSESDNLQSSIFNLQLEWRTTDDFRDGYIDCRHIFQTMDRVSAYACTSILSPKEQQVQFTAYHDDGIRIWLNGKLCFENSDCSYSQFEGVLQQGKNLLLIRLTNFVDGWGFILRVTDRDGQVLEDLKYAQPHLNNLTPETTSYRNYAENSSGGSLTNSTATLRTDTAGNLTQILMELPYWAKARSGNWEKTAEGIKVYGTAYRGGNIIFSKSFYNFVNSELFTKWMPHGGKGYNYASFGVGINIAPGIGGTTHHAYGKAHTRIYDDTWYYTRIKINADKTYTAVMSTVDYDINGGVVVKSKSETLSSKPLAYIEKANIGVSFNDNYAGTSAYMIVAEVKTDAAPVQMTILTSYDFENTVDVPAQFMLAGNWVIDTIGFNSSKSLHNTDSLSSISLEVTDAAAVSFRFKCSGPYSSGFIFHVDDVEHWSGLCREILAQWNELIVPIPGTGTHTLKWSSFNGASLWIDDITIYTVDNDT